MNWKVILVSCIALILIAILLYFKVIGIDVGVVTSIAALMGIFTPILSSLIKPKVSLTIKDPQLEKTEYDGIEGYKVRTQVTNKGSKIVFNLTAAVNFTELVKFLRVDIEDRDGHKTYKTSEDVLKENEYSWIDKEEKAMKDLSLEKLRKDDIVHLLFPKKLKPGMWVAVGRRSTGWSYDTLLKLDRDKNYQIVITLKGEDYQKNTIIKTKKFKIEVPT